MWRFRRKSAEPDNFGQLLIYAGRFRPNSVRFRPGFVWPQPRPSVTEVGLDLATSRQGWLRPVSAGSADCMVTPTTCRNTSIKIGWRGRPDRFAIAIASTTTVPSLTSNRWSNTREVEADHPVECRTNPIAFQRDHLKWPSFRYVWLGVRPSGVGPEQLPSMSPRGPWRSDQ